MKKKQKKNIFIVTIIFVIIVSLSVGYSFFQESLNVSGSASTLPFQIDDKLDINLIKNGTTYTTYSIPSDMTYQSENLIDNELTISFTRQKQTGKPETSTFSINFTNSYTSNLTNGKVVATRVSGNEVSSFTGSINKTVLTPSESATVTGNVSFNLKEAFNLKIEISFDYEGYTQYFYYYIVLV